MKRKVKKGPKIIGLLLLAVALFFGIQYLVESQTGSSLLPSGKKKTITVSTTAWVGHAAGPYANRGFRSNSESQFSKRGITVNFVHNDDPVATKDFFVNGNYDMMWFTVDALPAILEKASDLARVNPVVLAMIDRSNGGDALVGRQGISNINDLKGKSIAFAEKTPSHSLVIQVLSAAGLTMRDIRPVICSDPLQAADMFKTGRVDAAAVWSPDDIVLLEEVRGSRLLFSTKDAPYAIMDILLAKKSWLEENVDIATAFLEEWFIAAGQIENSGDASIRERTIDILGDGYQGFDREFFAETFDNARRSTYGDNLNFFGLSDDFIGVTGEQLYSRMALAYKELGVINDPVPWRNLIYLEPLKNVNLSPTGLNAAERMERFMQASKEAEVAQAISTKSVSVEFPTGSAVLDNNAKRIIDLAFVSEAKTFATMRIRVVGNTDNTGSHETNMRLSRERAQAVVDYLVDEHGFEKNRFIVRGDGPKQAIADGVQGNNANYRVTNFELVSN